MSLKNVTNSIRNNRYDEFMIQNTRKDGTFRDHASTHFNDLPKSVRKTEMHANFITDCKQYYIDKAIARTI